MKLKCVKLGNPTQKSMVLLVKSPSYLCKEVLLAAGIELHDPLGHAVMATYPDNFEVVHYGAAPAKAEAAVATAKKQKVVTELETK